MTKLNILELDRGGALIPSSGRAGSFLGEVTTALSPPGTGKTRQSRGYCLQSSRRRQRRTPGVDVSFKFKSFCPKGKIIQTTQIVGGKN